ncbi:MAG: helix-turn-helix domain-containing protein [Myxococcota bacterium]
MADRPGIDGAWAHCSGDGGSTVEVPPDGCADLVVVVDGTRASAFVVGPSSALDRVTLPPGQRLAGIRFRCGVGPVVLDVDGAALADRSIPLDDLDPNLTRRLVDRIDGGPLLAAVRSVADALVARARWTPDRRRVLRGIALLQAGSAVGALADGLGTSDRSLRRAFAATVGLSPRAVGRVLRFQRALAAITAGRPLAEVAYTCGYADQAHLSREVRALAGAPPSVIARGTPSPTVDRPWPNRSSGPAPGG